MKRFLQVNPGGAWNYVQPLRCDPVDGAGDLDNVKAWAEESRVYAGACIAAINHLNGVSPE